MPLAAVDPLTIEVSQVTIKYTYWVVTFRTSMSKPVISVESDMPNSFLKNRRSETSLLFTNKDIALRISRALKHAVKLSGGKVDPF